MYVISSYNFYDLFFFIYLREGAMLKVTQVLYVNKMDLNYVDPILLHYLILHMIYFLYDVLEMK